MKAPDTDILPRRNQTPDPLEPETEFLSSPPVDLEATPPPRQLVIGSDEDPDGPTQPPPALVSADTLPMDLPISIAKPPNRAKARRAIDPVSLIVGVTALIAGIIGVFVL